MSSSTHNRLTRLVAACVFVSAAIIIGVLLAGVRTGHVAYSLLGFPAISVTCGAVYLINRRRAQ